MSLAVRTAECRPPNENAIRGIPELKSEILGDYPVHLLSSVIKGLTNKHGGKIHNIQIRHAKNNQFTVEYCLIGGGQ